MICETSKLLRAITELSKSKTNNFYLLTKSRISRLRFSVVS